MSCHKPPRLPSSQLTLPGNFKITVKYRTNRQINAVMNEDCYGYWAVGANGGDLILNKDVPLWRQLQTFGHELVHAVHDYAHWLNQHAETLREEGEETQRALEQDE